MTEGRRPAGFTLIEVLVALTILGFVLSTGYRILQGSIDRLRIETHAITLAGHAEAIWYALKLEGLRTRSGLSLGLPDTIEFDVSTSPIETSEFDDWQAKGNIEWVVLSVRYEGQEIQLEGVMPTLP